MQGTSHVRSLVRLFIGAVLLWLAWMVLTSGQASAAERSDISAPLSERGRSLPLGVDTEGLETVLGTALGKDSGSDPQPAGGAARPAKAHPVTPSAPSAKSSWRKSPAASPVDEKASAATPSAAASLVVAVDEVESHFAPVVEVVEVTVRPTVDNGLALVSDVSDIAAEVPVVGGPVAHVSDAVVALVPDLPLVGGPLPIVPLPIGDGTPTGVVTDVVPGVVEVVGAVRPPALSLGDTTVPVRTSLVSLGDLGAAPLRDATSAQAVLRATQRGPGEPAGPGAPRGSTPVLPNQPSPTGGATQGAGDPAMASPGVVLPNLQPFGRSRADRRVPRGLPDHPGTRPD